jgi:putative acyl-CoA dehydrogenase
MNKPVDVDALRVPQLPPYVTHEVRNQARPATGFNAFSDDAVLTAAIGREAPWAATRCAAVGALAGDAGVQDAARLANENVPKLRTHDRFGNRIDWVEFHPAWHQLMTLAYRHQVHSLAWTAEERHPHYARAVLAYLWNQVEHGTGCPTGMAYAAHAGFSGTPALAIWADKVRASEYDASREDVGRKKSVVVGYAMTEKQGGSDLRQTQTTAVHSHAGDYHGVRADWYSLTGHKWFCSVPVADGFFTLAKVSGGVTCFFVPRTLEDGAYNPFFIQRLKDKCGNRSNASSEIEYAGTLALRVGDEGHGIREILSHAHLTRLDFAVGSAGLMRQALTLALTHTSTRQGFGKPLAAQPMMANVLADMAIEVEAATLLALRVAKATDHLDDVATERAFARIATPIAKFFNCSRAPAIAYEALQCHGGNGFVEENPIARLYREAPLNSVWEGTANMMCMDVRRAIQRDRATLDAVMTDLGDVRGADARLDRFVAQAGDLALRACANEFFARAATEALARAIQGAELVRNAPEHVADAFVATRLADGGGAATLFGAMGAAMSKGGADRIVERALPSR